MDDWYHVMVGSARRMGHVLSDGVMIPKIMPKILGRLEIKGEQQ